MKKITTILCCYLILSGLGINVFAQTPTPTATPTTSPTPEMCALKIVKAEIEFKDSESSDKAKIRGTFSAGKFDDSSNVTVTIGSSSTTITDAFDPTANGWKFEGEIDGSKVTMRIEDLNDSFNFTYEKKNTDLAGTSNPINIQFENGENNCEVEIWLNGKLKFIEEGEVDSEIDCSNEEDNIIIGSCDTGVKDFAIGDSSLCEEIRLCSENIRNHGEFVSCISDLTNDLKRDDLLLRNKKGKIQRCASRSNIGKGNNRNSIDDDSSDDDSKDED